MTGPVEAAAYQRRRVLAALLGRDRPPPGVLRPLAGGGLFAAILVAVELVRGWR